MNFNFVKKNKFILLLLFIFLIIGSLILNNYFSLKNLESDVSNQYETHRDLLIEKAALNIENDLTGKKLEINLLEKKIVLDEIIFNSCSDTLFSTQTNFLTNLENYFVIDKNGKIISCSDPNYFDYLNLNIGDTKYFKEVLNSKNTIVKHIKTSSPGQLYLLTPILTNKNKYDSVALLSVIEINDLYSKYIHELVGNNNNNFYYLLNKQNSKMIMKSEELNQTLIDSFNEKSIKKENFIIFNSNKFIFNKKQFKVGNEIWELGILSSTQNIDNMFVGLNKKHIISISFILIVLFSLILILLKENNLKKEEKNNLKKSELTLEDCKINIENETLPSQSLAENKLVNGNIYFIRDDFSQAYELFIQEINNKKIGLGFLKSDIDKFKIKYNLDKTSFVKLGTENIFNSKYKILIDTKIIFKLISDFIKKTNKPKIIFIDYLDYVILQNSFKEVLINLYELKEKIKNSNNIFIFSLNQNAISSRELLALEKEFIDIETQEKKSMQNISDLELQILIYINNSNNNKIEVRYKDISQKFNITKPTTSKKINQLEKNDLILIKDLGRRKIIEITQKGRKII